MNTEPTKTFYARAERGKKPAGSLKLTLCVHGAIHRVHGALEAAYGANPTSLAAYLRLSLRLPGAHPGAMER